MSRSTGLPLIMCSHSPMENPHGALCELDIHCLMELKSFWKMESISRVWLQLGLATMHAIDSLWNHGMSFSSICFFLLDSPSSSSRSVLSSSDSSLIRLRFPLSGLEDSLNAGVSSALITMALVDPLFPLKLGLTLAPCSMDSIAMRSMESMVVIYWWSAESLLGLSLVRSKASFVVTNLIAWDLAISPFLYCSMIVSISPTIAFGVVLSD